MLVYLIFLILLFFSTIIIIKNDIGYGKALAKMALGLCGFLSVFMLILSFKESAYSSIGALMCVFFSLIGFLILWASTYMIDREIENKKIPLYYSLILILIASLCGIVIFDNTMVVFIFVELSAFLASGIVMIKDEQENYRAGLKYLFLSMFASVFLLIGVVILYRLTGSFNIHEMLLGDSDFSLLKYSFIFIFIAIALKSALFPFHIWLPDAHGSAPSTSSAILSSLVIKAYIIFFIKLIYQGFGIQLVRSLDILPIITTLGICGMVYGSILAIMQRKLKSLIAYSSVAQIGYIFMGIGLGTPLGLVASVFHIIAHGVTKSCLFLSAGRIINASGQKEVKLLKGIGKSLPTTMAIYTICSLSMVGIPLFAGFITKWNFAYAAIDVENMLIIIVLSLSSLLNGIYFLPMVLGAYFNIDETKKIQLNLEPKGQFPVGILGFLVIVIGIFSSPLIEFLNSIIDKLI